MVVPGPADRDQRADGVAGSGHLQHKETVEAEGAIQARWVLGLGLLTAVAYWVPRRGQQRPLWLPTASVGALIAVVLGIATYSPCVSPEARYYAPIAWVLSLFTGDYEFDGPGAVCAKAFPPGFELARSIALSLTLAGALGVALVLARRQLDRWAAARSGDVDVVVGLDGTTIPLIEALIAERRTNRGRAPWINTRPGWLGGSSAGAVGVSTAWWWLTGLRRGDARRIFKLPPRVIVLESDPDNALIDRVRRDGAIVLICDPKDEAHLRPVITRFRIGPRRRIALRRLYAVTPDQRLNHTIRDVTGRILAEDLERHVEDLVPRVFVRMDDAREARRWRLHQIQRLGADTAGSVGSSTMLVNDSLTMDGIAAEIVVGQVAPDGSGATPQSVATQLVLVGDGQLALTILDELAWQFWCRFELASARHGNAEPEVPTLRLVTLAGPKADIRQEEWDEIRAPWSLPAHSVLGDDFQLFDVTAADGDGELIAARILNEDPGAAVVFVDGTTEAEAAASRLARRFPGKGPGHARVILRADNGSASAGSVIPGGLFRFVPALVSHHAGVPVPPQDSVTRLARQQHSVYRERHAREQQPLRRGEGGHACAAHGRGMGGPRAVLPRGQRPAALAGAELVHEQRIPLGTDPRGSCRRYGRRCCRRHGLATCRSGRGPRRIHAMGLPSVDSRLVAV